MFDHQEGSPPEGDEDADGEAKSSEHGPLFRELRRRRDAAETLSFLGNRLAIAARFSSDRRNRPLCVFGVRIVSVVASDIVEMTSARRYIAGPLIKMFYQPQGASPG